MCWYPSEARVATLLSCLGLFLTVRAVAFAMSGIPPSQAASEAARGLQRGPFRPGQDRTGKTKTSVASDGASDGDGGSPSHLVVLVHGLGGTPEDLSYLKESLDRRGGEGVLVHLARCNQGKTRDGVAMGGERLAKEVVAVVESTPSLSRISLVGNSLGGLYVRYAVKLLYRAGVGDATAAAGTAAAEVAVGRGGVNGSGSTDGSLTTAATTTATATPTATSTTTATATAKARGSSTRKAPKEEVDTPTVSSSHAGEDKKAAAAAAVGAGVAGESETVAGLKPSVFMTIASPHLGVRRFTYVPLPTPLHGLASVFVGKTGSDLFLERSGDNSAAFPPPPPPPGPFLSPSAVSGAVRRFFSLLPGDAGGEAVGNGPWVGSGSAGGAGVGAGREASLLYEMATSEEFLRPLKAFRWRRAYANRRGDFMVPYETAAFVSPGEGDGSETMTMATPAAAVAARGAEARKAGERAGGGAGHGGRGRGKKSQEEEEVETQEVDTGATASEFTVVDRVLGAKHGAIVGMARVLPASAVGAMAGAGSRDGAEVGAGMGAVAGSKDNHSGAELRSEGGAEVEAVGGGGVAARVAVAAGVAASERPVRPGRTRIFAGSKASARPGGKKTMEEEMADGLNSCGWEKVSVDFGGLAPFSHNKICALSRSPLTRAVFRSGKTVVDHAANFLVSYDLKEDLEDLKNGGGGGGSHGG